METVRINRNKDLGLCNDCDSIVYLLMSNECPCGSTDIEALEAEWVDVPVEGS